MQIRKKQVDELAGQLLEVMQKSQGKTTKKELLGTLAMDLSPGQVERVYKRFEYLWKKMQNM